MDAIILLAGLLLLGIYLFIKKETEKIETINDAKNEIKKDWSNVDEKVVITAYKYISSYPFQRITYDKKDYAILIALLMKESGSSILNKDNANVLGDLNLKNKAIGYFQVRKPALIDVNKEFGGDYTELDLYDKAINLLIASRYFYLCYHRNNTGKDFYEKLWLSAKRYNGGRKETMKSINNRATNYANTYLKLYSKVENILRYKGLY
jgi:hypothetical protein